MRLLENERIVTVQNVEKIFPLYPSQASLVKEFLHPFRKKYHIPFKAIDNISFEVSRGETIGIIGKNGSGKSTLLKIICGITSPTKGGVLVDGKISSLLELGAGFNPDLTGVENIYFLGSLSGLSNEEMKKKIDDICDFADIGQFIFQPVKKYSSGMFVRLAFAVAINVDPEIFIVDEALSVGDLSFQLKCYRKFQEFKNAGKTIIFVTHSLDTVIKYCDRALVLHQGKLAYIGNTKDAVDLYKQVEAGLIDANSMKLITKQQSIEESVTIENANLIEYGTKEALIYRYDILDLDQNSLRFLRTGSKIIVKMEVKFFKKSIDPIFAFTIKDIKGLEVTGTNSHFEGISTGTYLEGDSVLVTFELKVLLSTGNYTLSLGCSNWEPEFVVYHRLYDIILFEVASETPCIGFVNPRARMTFIRRERKETKELN